MAILEKIMKLAVIVVRTLMGLLFLFASSAFLFKLVPQPELAGNVKLFMDGVNATGYLMPFIKITELVCGLAFVTGFFVPLASVVIAPIILNIFLFHLFVDTSGLVMGSALVLSNIFLGYAHWNKFRPMLAAK